MVSVYIEMLYLKFCCDLHRFVQGLSPLMYAAANGDEALIQLLLQAKANPNLAVSKHQIITQTLSNRFLTDLLSCLSGCFWRTKRMDGRDVCCVAWSRTRVEDITGREGKPGRFVSPQSREHDRHAPAIGIVSR